MAAQRMPLGHKRRGEAERANAIGPGGRTLRERYAYGMRHAAAPAAEVTGFLNTDGRSLRAAGPGAELRGFFGPGGRTLRERYARGMRGSARDLSASVRIPYGGGAPAAPVRRVHIVRDFTN